MTIVPKSPLRLQRMGRIAVLVLALIPSASCGLGSPPPPTVRLQSSCDITSAPAQVDAYQVYWNFAPGSWTSQHSHSGPVCASTLEGSITFRSVNPASEKTVVAGESFVEVPNQVHRAGTWNGSGAVLIGTNLTPRGKPQANVVDPAQTATRTFVNQVQIDGFPTQLTVTHTVLDFAPGAWTPTESHAGKMLNTVLTGTITLRANGTDKIFTPGQFWSNDAGVAYAVGNATSASASIFVSALVAKGA